MTINDKAIEAASCKLIELTQGMWLDYDDMTVGDGYLTPRELAAEIIKAHDEKLWCEDMSQAPRDEWIYTKKGKGYMIVRWQIQGRLDHYPVDGFINQEGVMQHALIAWRHLPEYRKG